MLDFFPKLLEFVQPMATQWLQYTCPLVTSNSPFLGTFANSGTLVARTFAGQLQKVKVCLVRLEIISIEMLWKSWQQHGPKKMEKSGKRLKPKTIPSFLGDIRLRKLVPEYSFGHPKCHFLYPFLPKEPIFWYNKNSETTFISPTSPKNDERVQHFWGGCNSQFQSLPLVGQCSLKVVSRLELNDEQNWN